MEKIEFNKVYVETASGLAEYMGGPNFINGKRTCPNCKGSMVRKPINVAFKKMHKGKTLVKPDSDNGAMIMVKEQPDFIWACKTCSLALSRRKA